MDREYDLTEDVLLQAMDKANADRAVIVPVDRYMAVNNRKANDAILAAAAAQPNVWSCLCGPHMRAIEIFCKKVDPDRIVWGTDFGFSFADSIEYRLNLIRSAKISDDLRERILGRNPLRLMGMTNK